ncbi:hypothetical protein AB205_0133780 [Aquarana catesbeiana]|uniref:Uncharacterized protein n=1 Tax=Aquarana catesbeiana TaxID=8400 RepID=A0A2G9RCE9_AQUCT|nr:hypothetical protein AB205_0133780 [Aquarana catesbeiana]
MFHIPFSGLKYLCAKYTFCFILIGEQRLGKYEDTRDPSPPPEEGEQRSQPEDVEEGDVVEIVTTTVLIQFKSQIWKMHTDVSTCAICHQEISMYAFCGCNPFLPRL